VGTLSVLFLLLQASGETRTYAVDAAASQVAVKVGKAGLFKMAGHEHTVVAEGFSGEVLVNPANVARSSVHVVFTASAVRVADSEGKDDIPKVQATMEGPKVLDVARFPEVRFTSTSVTERKHAGDQWELLVAGDLELHGVKRPLTVPLRVTLGPDSLTAEGAVRLAQKDFGIEPVSVGGVVKVKDELEVTLKIVARAGQSGSSAATTR
jgi:polyisoprenoid-binding protein YceI